MNDSAYRSTLLVIATFICGFLFGALAMTHRYSDRIHKMETGVAFLVDKCPAILEEKP